MRTLLWGDKDTTEVLEKELHKGGVVLAEGDTVLGLLANVSQQGIRSLDLIKNRSKKPYLILVSDYKKALNLIDYSPQLLFQIEKLMNICWPGPITLIFKAKSTILRVMKSDDGTIALRVPYHEPLLKLLTHFDGLFSTSANNSGEPVPLSAEEVNSSIINSVKYVVLNDVSKNKDQSVLPSTIIDCTGARLSVVRHGAFELDKLTDVFGKELFLFKE